MKQVRNIKKISQIKGLSLLEILIILGVITFFIFLNYSYYVNVELRREADQTTEQLIQYVDAVETYLSLSTSRPTYQNGVKWLKVRKLLPKNYELRSFFLKKNSIEVYVTRLSRDSLVANIKVGPFKYKDKSDAIAERVSKLLNNHFSEDKQLSGVSSILAKQNSIKIKVVFRQLKDPWLRVDGGNSMKGDLTFSGQQSAISGMTDLDFVGGAATITSVNTNSKSQQEMIMYGEPTFNISSNNIYINTNKKIDFDISQANIGADAKKVYFSSNNKIKLGDVRFDVFKKQNENQRAYLSDFLSLFDAQRIQKMSLTRNNPSTTISTTCKKNQKAYLFVYITNYTQNTHDYGWPGIIPINLPVVSDDKYVGKGVQVDNVSKDFKVEMLKNKQGEYYYSDVEFSAMLVCEYLINGG